MLLRAKGILAPTDAYELLRCEAAPAILHRPVILVVFNSRIDQAIENIHQEHHRQQERRIEYRHAHDRRVVTLGNTVYKMYAQTRNCKDLLYDKASRQQVCDRRSKHCDDRDQCIPQCMPENDLCL